MMLTSFLGKGKVRRSQFFEPEARRMIIHFPSGSGDQDNLDHGEQKDRCNECAGTFIESSNKRPDCAAVLVMMKMGWCKVQYG